MHQVEAVANATNCAQRRDGEECAHRLTPRRAHGAAQPNAGHATNERHRGYAREWASEAWIPLLAWKQQREGRDHDEANRRERNASQRVARECTRFEQREEAARSETVGTRGQQVVRPDRLRWS